MAKDKKKTKKEKVISGAGGVVFNGQGHVLILEHREGSWVFPKGHIDKGETALEAAQREVEEESGISAQRLGTVSETTQYQNAKKQKRKITWFLMTTRDKKPLLREAQFPGGDFFPPEKAEQRLTFPEDKRLFLTMLKHFRSLEVKS